MVLKFQCQLVSNLILLTLLVATERYSSVQYSTVRYWCHSSSKKKAIWVFHILQLKNSSLLFQIESVSCEVQNLFFLLDMWLFVTKRRQTFEHSALLRMVIVLLRCHVSAAYLKILFFLSCCTRWWRFTVGQ